MTYNARLAQGAFSTINEENFTAICDELAGRDHDLAQIIRQYHYPPLWKRPPGFETLVHIILEQQVSLASALAALHKIKAVLGNQFTPSAFLALSDDTLRACYFSRQKTIYTHHLANAIINGTLVPDAFGQMEDAEVRAQLVKIKGIGQWTADVYLMMVLQRPDLFPSGDIALMTSIREVKNLSLDTPRDTILLIASRWQPYRTVATFLLWHAYLSKRKK